MSALLPVPALAERGATTQYQHSISTAFYSRQADVADSNCCSIYNLHLKSSDVVLSWPLTWEFELINKAGSKAGSQCSVWCCVDPGCLCCDGGDLGCCSCWVVVVVQVMKLLVSWKLLVTVSSASARLTLCSRSPSRLSSSAPAMALSHCTRGRSQNILLKYL